MEGPDASSLLFARIGFVLATHFHPVRQGQVPGEDVYDLENDPAAYQVDAQHLPEGEAVGFLDQLLYAA